MKVKCVRRALPFLAFLLVGCSQKPSSSRAVEKPPVAAVRPFTETFYGVTLSDPYRYMEKLDPETIDWMKAQGARTTKILDSIGPRAALEKRLADFNGSFGVVGSPSFGAQPYEPYAGRLFYTAREPGS